MTKIQCESDPMPLCPCEDTELVHVGFCAGDFVGGVLAGSLKTELDVVEAGFDERGEFCFVQRKAGSDEVDVEAGGAGSADEIDDVRSRERLAAREIGLEDAGFRSFSENTRPNFGGEFVGAGLHFERIGAVDAVQRAAVREFRYERQWVVDR